MRRSTSICAWIVTLAVSTTTFAETHVVEISGFEFKPQVLLVQAGDSVIWRNNDIVPHTATAADESWDTGAIPAGDEKQVQIEKSFNLDYYCRYHLNMLGSIEMSN